MLSCWNNVSAQQGVRQVMAKLFGVRLCYPCPGDSIASAACELLVFFDCSAAVA